MHSNQMLHHNYVQMTVNFESYLNIRNILTKEVKCVHLSIILMLS